MSKRIKTKYERKYARIARAAWKRATSLISGYPVAMTVPEANKEATSSSSRTLFSSFPLVDKDMETYLRKLKRAKRNIRGLESRTIALNFLNTFFSGEPGKIGSDAIVSNLQALLSRQFRRGVEYERRQAALRTKKRK